MIALMADGAFADLSAGRALGHSMSTVIDATSRSGAASEESLRRYELTIMACASHGADR